MGGTEEYVENLVELESVHMALMAERNGSVCSCAALPILLEEIPAGKVVEFRPLAFFCWSAWLVSVVSFYPTWPPFFLLQPEKAELVQWREDRSLGVWVAGSTPIHTSSELPIVSCR
jgi:hypothetical protein